MKQIVKLNESQLRQVIKEGIRNILSETNDLPDVTDDDREYVDSLHLNQNIPHEGWFRDDDGLYKIGPDGEKYHDRYGSLKYMPYVDKSGKRHETHVSTSDRFNDPINDDDYTKRLYMRHAHGNGKFLRNGTCQSDPAANYVQTGKAMTKNDLWGYYDIEGDVDKDMSDLNKKIKKQNDNNLKRSLSAADKRPLHGKDSLNRVGMKMNESQLSQVIRENIKKVLKEGKPADRSEEYGSYTSSLIDEVQKCVRLNLAAELGHKYHMEIGADDSLIITTKNEYGQEEGVKITFNNIANY